MKPREIDPPATSLNTARRGEAVLIVLQNNADKSLVISNINDIFSQLLGIEAEEFVGRRLETILSSRTALSLADDIEYIDDAPDFGDVFSRIRDVRFRRRDGVEIPIQCTLSRMMVQGHSACFQIVIPNEQDKRVSHNLRQFIALNLDGRKELDELTGLPNHKTAKEFLPLLENYLSESSMDVVFAVIRLDRHSKSLARYGQLACAQLLLHAYHCCRSTFRAEDMIFALSDHTLGVVLFDISRESSRVVLNRLRWKIKTQRFAFGGKPDFSMSSSISFDMLNAKSAEEVFDRCEKTIGELDANERNMLVELGAA